MKEESSLKKRKTERHDWYMQFKSNHMHSPIRYEPNSIRPDY
jgi:hypothetical protein